MMAWSVWWRRNDVNLVGGKATLLFGRALDTILSREGVAKSTKGKYGRLFRRFMEWWRVFGNEFDIELRCEFVNEKVFLLFFTYERNWKGAGWNVLRSMMCAIRHSLLIVCQRDVFKKNRAGEIVHMYALERFLRVIKRDDAGVEGKKKFALTKFVLNEMAQFFNMDNLDDVVMWTALCIGVACLLRLSEFCVVKTESEDDKILKGEDLTMSHKRGKTIGFLQLHDTKTKMFSLDNKVSFFKDGTVSCAVGAVERWAKWRGAGTESKRKTPLFMMSNGKPLNFKNLDKKVRQCLGLLGYDMKLFRGWSTRRGGAMTLARAGVSDRVIRGMGRWKSWCYRMYMELQDEEKAVAAELVATASRKVAREGESIEEVCERIETWELRESWIGRRSA